MLKNGNVLVLSFGVQEERFSAVEGMATVSPVLAFTHWTELKADLWLTTTSPFDGYLGLPPSSQHQRLRSIWILPTKKENAREGTSVLQHHLTVYLDQNGPGSYGKKDQVWYRGIVYETQFSITISFEIHVKYLIL